MKSTRTAYVDGATLLAELKHLEETNRVLGRLFAHPIAFGDAATGPRTPLDVPRELQEADENR